MQRRLLCMCRSMASMTNQTHARGLDMTEVVAGANPPITEGAATMNANHQLRAEAVAREDLGRSQGTDQFQGIGNGPMIKAGMETMAEIRVTVEIHIRPTAEIQIHMTIETAETAEMQIHTTITTAETTEM